MHPIQPPLEDGNDVMFTWEIVKFLVYSIFENLTEPISQNTIVVQNSPSYYAMQINAWNRLQFDQPLSYKTYSKVVDNLE